MGELKESFVSVRREPWFYSVLLLSLVPLFSDYVSFPLIFLSLFFAVRDAHNHGKRLSFGTLGLLMAAYLAYMALSLFYTTDFSGSFWSLIMWVSVFAAYLAAATVLTDRRRLRTAILCMTTVTGVVGGITVAQYLLREFITTRVSSKLWQSVDTVIYNVLRIPLSNTDFGDRISGTFNNPNLLAAYLVLTIPFSIAFVLTGTRSKPKAAARIALILSAYALGFSFSRGGYVALIVVALMLMVLYIRKKFVMTVLAALYIVLLIPPAIGNRMITAIPHSTQQSAASTVEEIPGSAAEPLTYEQALKKAIDSIGHDVTKSYDHDDSVHMRFVLWKKVLHSVGEHPLFGSGIGVQTTQQTLTAAGLNYKHAHNLFLEILAEGGAVSLLFFLGILWTLVSRGWQLLRRKNTEVSLLGFAIIGACVALCVHGVFDFPLLTPRLMTVGMLLMGITESAARLYLHVPVPEPYGWRQVLHGSRHASLLYK